MNGPTPNHRSSPQEPIPLTEMAIPAQVPEQLARFTMESIRAHQEGAFQVSLPEGVSVLAVDLGGDSLTAAVKTVSNGVLAESEVLFDMKGVKNGVGYLPLLQGAAGYAVRRDLPVGISYAGPIEGTSPAGGENVRIFMKQLGKRHGGDFQTLFPTLAAVENDAVAGLKAGVLYVRQFEAIKNVIYGINGSGQNASVFQDGMTWSSEAGHVEVVDQLNPHGQQRSCNLFGDYVCIERVGAGKAGIEDLWLQLTGEALSGREIEELYKDGNKLAGELYDNSALITALMVQGVAKALNIDLRDGSTAVVGHGGTFKFPDFGPRVQQIVGAHEGATPPLFMTKDFSTNACLDGAALAALAKVGS